MSYFGELRAAWRPLLGATIGLASGLSVVGVITSTIVPSVVAELQWSKAEFAAVASVGMFMALVIPFIGRLTDVVGVRRTALIGQIALPLVYLAYSRMDGPISTYIVIFIVQSLLCVTTTATVYTRLVVQHVRAARGMALAIVVSGPALSGAIIAPLLNNVVEAEGWRVAYFMVAIGTAIAGAIAFLLIPPDRSAGRDTRPVQRRARYDYPLILRATSFWILAAAMLLCNLPQTLMQVQMKMLMLDNGVPGPETAVMISVASLGMLAGRFVTGAALDRYSATIVAFTTLGLPSVGLFLIASDLDAPAILTFGVFCVGFAFGSEGDIVAFLVARQFGVAIYSSVMGLLTAIIAVSTAAGALLLGFTLDRTGGFDLYLVICGVAVLLGAGLLLFLPRDDASSDRTAPGKSREALGNPH